MRKLFLLIIISTISLYGQISLTGSGVYSENFNTLAQSGTSSTVPTGWSFSESGTGANTTYTAGTGSSNTGDTYSFGASGSSDRSFGTLISSSVTSIIGASFTNNTGFTISSIPISYTGKQWRIGVTNRNAADKLQFEYSTDATSLTTGTWTSISNLDFSSPVINGTLGPTDGTSSTYQTSISYTITGLNIANGSTFWIRWTDYNIASSDDGLAIDDFSIDQTALPVELTSFTASTNENTVSLNWQTATEVNNYGFEVERKIPDQVRNDNSGWLKVGFVAGAGNSNSPKSYTFTDQPSGGTSFSYRLKQLDNDGKYKFYDAITVSLSALNEAKLMQNSPNPFNPSTVIKFFIPNDSDVKIQIFDILGREVQTLLNTKSEAGYHIVYWNGKDNFGQQVSSGVYLYRLTAGNFVETKKMNLLK